MSEDELDRALRAVLNAFAHDGNYPDTIGAIKNICRLEAADRIEVLEKALRETQSLMLWCHRRLPTATLKEFVEGNEWYQRAVKDLNDT